MDLVVGWIVVCEKGGWGGGMFEELAMTGVEVRKLKDEEIAVELKRLRGKLFTMRTQTVTEKVEDLSQFEKIRRDIARLMTEQSARSRRAS